MASEKPALNPLGFTRQAIAKYPDPVLLKKAQPIVEHTWLAASDGVLTHTDNRLVGVSQLAQSMLWLMNELNALGIAAPQVYRSVQLVVVRKKWSYSPFTTLYHTILHPATWDDIIVMCDPKVTFLGMPVTSFEGCLSLPGRMYTVVRNKQILVDYDELTFIDDKFRLDRQCQEYTGMVATIIQHEVDHLNGILINATGVPHEEKTSS